MRISRRRVATALVGVGLAGLAVSAAASLDLAGTDLAAGSTVVGSCQPAGQAVEVAYDNAYSPAIKGFRVTGVELRGVAAACVGQDAAIALTDAAGAPLFEAAAVVSGATVAFTVPAGVSAAAVTGTAVVIAD